MSENCLREISDAEAALTAEIQEDVIAELDCSSEVDDAQILRIIDDRILCRSEEAHIGLQKKQRIRKDIFNSLRGYDILQELMDDDSVTEIMVNGTRNIFYEKNGCMYCWDRHFGTSEHLEDIIQRVISGTNRSVNERFPIADARLADGSRINVVLSPVSLDGPAVTIRRFPKDRIDMKKLIAYGTLSDAEADLLKTIVKEKKNVLISGGTGTGKTTFLNALSDFIGSDERVITIEDSAELQLCAMPNIVRMECRNANTQGIGEISIRTLIRTALRMRPDRIIIGEVRGAEAVDLLQALNTGHAGSLSTIHANSCADVFSRFETMVLTGIHIPVEAIRRQMASALQILIHLEREPDKSRKLSEIVEIETYENGKFTLKPLYQRKKEGNG